MNNSQQANSNADRVGNVVGRHGRYVVGKEGDVVGKNLTVVGKVDRVVGMWSVNRLPTTYRQFNLFTITKGFFCAWMNLSECVIMKSSVVK